MHTPVLKNSVLPGPLGELYSEERQSVMPQQATPQQAVIVPLPPTPIGVWVDGQGFSKKEQQAEELVTMDASTLETLVLDANLLLDRLASIPLRAEAETESGNSIVSVHEKCHSSGHEKSHSDGHEEGSKPSIRSIPSEALPEVSKKVRELQKLLFGVSLHDGVHADTGSIGLN